MHSQAADALPNIHILERFLESMIHPIELLIFSEAHEKFRYCLIIGEIQLKSTATFDNWTDALAEAIREAIEEWGEVIEDFSN